MTTYEELKAFAEKPGSDRKLFDAELDKQFRETITYLKEKGIDLSAEQGKED